MLNTHEDDPCCSAALQKALRDGELDSVKSWTCPICGLEWRARLITDDIRHWTPYEIIEVWR